MFNIKNFLNQVTARPGIYQMLGDQGKILYIGKARNLKKRLSSYFVAKQKDNKTLALLSHIQDIQVIVTRNENEALLLESNLIKKYQPHYNILFRDDKSYPYILIVHEGPYPYIDFYRGNKKLKGTYFGPYPNATATRETIHLIQKLFGLRAATDRYYPGKRPCLQYQLGLCSGACAGLISIEDYQRDVEHATLFLQGKNEQVLEALRMQMEQASAQLEFERAAKLRDQIFQLREARARQYISTRHADADVIALTTTGGHCVQLLMVRGGRVLGSRAYFPNVPPGASIEEIFTSFITQHYLGRHQERDVFPKEIILPQVLPDRDWLANALSEFAGHKISLARGLRGERKKWLEMALASAKQSSIGYFLKKSSLQQRFAALKEVLQLQQSIDRIECFDISHTRGELPVAACVVFNQEGPVKSDYRRFNIKDITPGDDVAAMRQVVKRRYHRLQEADAKVPDVILIDGGKQQLNVAAQTLRELMIDTLLVGVSKGEGRKPGLETLHLLHRSPLHLSNDSLALHLVQQIRDEAHRFAITGHRLKRDNQRNRSILERVPGIGPKRRRELLRYFGGIQAINRASLDELAKVPGISQSLAERIFAALHDVMT